MFSKRVIFESFGVIKPKWQCWEQTMQFTTVYAIPEGTLSTSWFVGLPLWLSWSRICLQCRRPGFDPWFGKIPWRRERLPTPVLWSGKFHGLYSPWGLNESDMTEWLSLHFTSLQRESRTSGKSSTSSLPQHPVSNSLRTESSFLFLSRRSPWWDMMRTKPFCFFHFSHHGMDEVRSLRRGHLKRGSTLEAELKIFHGIL